MRDTTIYGALWIENVKAGYIDRLVQIISKEAEVAMVCTFKRKMYLFKAVRYVPCLLIHTTCLVLPGGNTLFDIISVYYYSG